MQYITRYQPAASQAQPAVCVSGWLEYPAEVPVAQVAEEPLRGSSEVEGKRYYELGNSYMSVASRGRNAKPLGPNPPLRVLTLSLFYLTCYLEPSAAVSANTLAQIHVSTTFYGGVT